jgi:hypothetical protein
MSAFTWIPFYKELADRVLAYRDRQGELLAILKEIADGGVPMIRLTEKGDGDKDVPLAAIDPFTFFAAFNRKATDANRQAILTAIRGRLQIQAPVPSDFAGIPILHPMMSWFFPWEEKRKSDDIPALWKLAEAVVRRSPEAIPAALFDRCIDIDCVSVTNLTMGMFWMRPDTYLALDGRNRALLKKRGISHDVKDWSTYVSFLKNTKSSLPETPSAFSLAAYEGESERKYWVFQCNPAQYDIVGALQSGALKTWSVNQHKSDIREGDGVILWVTGEKAGCYAIATVTSEVTKMKEGAQEAAFWSSPSEREEFDGVTIGVDLPLCERPILKSAVAVHAEFKNFTGGRQGTNLAATKAQYDRLCELAKGGISMRCWKISHGKSDFGAEQRTAYLQESTVHVHKDTAKGQGNLFTNVIGSSLFSVAENGR